MRLAAQQGVVGQPNGMHWGVAEDGSPVLLLVAPGLAVHVQMTAAEAKQLGSMACYMGVGAELQGGAGDVRAASPLVGPDNMPLRGT